MSLCHDDLGSYYQVNFALMQHHKYSLSEIESMVPWERELYVGMLAQFLEEQRRDEDLLQRQNEARIIYGR